MPRQGTAGRTAPESRGSAGPAQEPDRAAHNVSGVFCVPTSRQSTPQGGPLPKVAARTDTCDHAPLFSRRLRRSRRSHRAGEFTFTAS